MPAGVPAGTSASEIIAASGAKTVFVPGGKPLSGGRWSSGSRRPSRKQLPASMTKAQRAAVIKRLETSPGGRAGRRATRRAAWTGSAPLPRGRSRSPSVVGVVDGAPPTVLGQGWLSVAVLSAGCRPAPGSAASPDGSLAQAFVALQAAATPVHGSWGSGRLLRTSLVSVLMTNGHILIGAVQPSVLYADAAQLSK